MSKYKDNFDKLANSIYNKLTEAAQQDPTMQAQQPVDPNAGAVADPTAGAAMQPDASAAGVAAADPSAMAAGVQDQSLQTGDEGQDTGEADEVGMSEIQEMAGQLAQMLRDFKETNPDEFIEAAKFAAGMVVSAAISGLKYKDRKDILKKVKAGEFNQDSRDESSAEEQPVEQQPEGQEGMVAERLRKDDSRETDDDRKGLNPKEKKNIRSKKSPFSGVNEEDENNVSATVPVTASTADLSQIANSASGKTVTFHPDGVTDPSSAITKSVSNTGQASDALKNQNSAKLNQQQFTSESVKLTKRQLDMIRLNETKTKFVKFSKKQLDEIINRQDGKNAQLAQKQNAVRQKLINDFFSNWDVSTHESTDELSRAIRILNSKSTDRSLNQEILRNAVVPYFLGLANGSEEINDVETLNNYIANGGNTENLVIVKVGNSGVVIDFNVANNIINRHIRALRGLK